MSAKADADLHQAHRLQMDAEAELATALRERDEARAEVERARKAYSQMNDEFIVACDDIAALTARSGALLALVESAREALEPFATDEFMDHGEDRTVLIHRHADDGGPERIVKASDFRRASTTYAKLKGEKTDV